MKTEHISPADRRMYDILRRDRLLDGLTISSGAIDAISFLALGKVFTAFMTGNIAFLGLGLAGFPEAPSVASLLSSMGGFAAGVYIATRIVTPRVVPAGQEPKSTPAWHHRTTVALAFSLIAHVCFIGVWLAVGAQPTGSVVPVLLALWALAMGMQSAAVRRLEVGGVFTTAATATFIFLVGDQANRPVTRAERRRLASVLVSLLVGATAGTYVLLHAPFWAPVLPFAITVFIVARAAGKFGRRSDMTQRVPQVTT